MTSVAGWPHFPGSREWRWASKLDSECREGAALARTKQWIREIIVSWQTYHRLTLADFFLFALYVYTYYYWNFLNRQKMLLLPTKKAIFCFRNFNIHFLHSYNTYCIVHESTAVFGDYLLDYIEHVSWKKCKAPLPREIIPSNWNEGSNSRE